MGLQAKPIGKLHRMLVRLAPILKMEEEARKAEEAKKKAKSEKRRQKNGASGSRPHSSNRGGNSAQY